METYFEISCKLPTGHEHLSDEISAFILNNFECDGVEDFNIDEPQVDEILGERSYSGGDLPLEILDEVENTHFNFKPTTNDLEIKYFFYGPESKERALICFEQLSNLDTVAEFNLNELDVQDWNQKWKESYQPIIISPKLEIIPSFFEDYESKSDFAIYIEPGMGFGTGSHETTFLCLKLFLLIESQLNSILDFGCGSGILGIAAKKLIPSAKVDLYDIDQNALDNSKVNINLNQMVSSDFRLLLPEGREKLFPKYDLIFANILLPVLLEEADFFAKSLESDNYLIVSGILNEQVGDILDNETYKNDFEVIETLSKNDWSAILLRKK